tara:strand:- start:250 stop:1194 length:945 start_codon:yes stop_codon:yes gene_type:complete
MKKILITGCAGFIGSHLCNYYLENKFKVFGIDNLLTGSVKNIESNFKNPNFKFIEFDICSEIKIKEKIDYILHFASPASPIDYLKHPIKTLRIGSIGTENLLDLAKKNDCIILVASSSEVYGDPLVHPQNESYFGNVNAVGPRGVYDEAKRYLEAITTAYKNKFNLNVRIARIFNTYGPNMRKSDGRAIPNFINQALSNKEITIYGDGTQTRSFSYIDDTVNGLTKLLESDYSYPVNIGNPLEYSINDLVEIILKITKSKSKVSYHKLPIDDPKVRRPDISIAKKKLSWNPKIELNIGLEKTIKYFKNLSNFKR